MDEEPDDVSVYFLTPEGQWIMRALDDPEPTGDDLIECLDSMELQMMDIKP